MGGWLGASHCLVGVMQRREAHTAPRPVRVAAVPGAGLGAASALGATCAVGCGAHGLTERQAKARANQGWGKPRPGQARAGASQGRTCLPPKPA